MNKIIRVLVVDDSAYIRKVVTQMLSRSPFIEVVGTAREGREALEQVARLQPDVVTLDLIMPELDGVGFLQEQMTRQPVPVLVVSIANEGGELALKALDAGAIDFIQKPTALATEKIFEVTDELIDKVKAAAAVPLKQILPAAVPLPVPALEGAGARQSRVDLVAIGVSTGGPQALKYLIPQLPADLPVPVGIVLHMPTGYTELYAHKLNELSSLTVIEAHEGAAARPGTVLLAPAGRHLYLVRDRAGAVVAHLDARPFDTPHRPSVDVLFRSAAEVYGARMLGVVMTGMGNDGKSGAAAVKARGGLIFTEAEQSCVVYGMPRAVDEAGLSDRRIPLDALAQEILKLV